jgi:hypothetical protein
MPDESNANGAPVGGEEMKQNPPKNFFCSLETEKEKKGGGGGEFPDTVSLVFSVFLKAA